MTLIDSGLLRIGYTPDSDDAFNYYAWEHGRVPSPAGFDARFERHHIVALNRAALRGEYDVVNVSSVIYPSVADRYRILAVGTSVGRGYGPVMVSERFGALDQLRGRRVGVGGLTTTGAALARMFCPAAHLIEMPYDEIADAILAGAVDAGVMIHEELLFYPEKGLRKVADLGATWCERQRLPLPVGLNLVRRDLGIAAAGQIAGACRESLLWAQQHGDEACAFAARFGRGCARQFVTMFSNQDTLCMPADVRRALRVLFDQLAPLLFAAALDRIEVIDA